MNKILYIIFFSLILTLSCNNESKKNANYDSAKPIKVELVKKDNQYTLLRNGKPYFIKGAGATISKISILAESGANSCRTWDTEMPGFNAAMYLDSAMKYGLTVTMGLGINKERKGFDYNDTAAVRKQLDYIKGEVLKYKDHPALLVWGIGNELNLNYSNPKVWDAVNDIAKFIKKVDPNHPTTTMLAGIGKNDIDEISKRCPDLDFVSIQMYGDLPKPPKRIEDSGYEGPYMVTEWGATGHWEVARTKWDVPIEQTSKEKAEAFIHRYKVAIEPFTDRCLGSYVFFWGQKQERTPTWYGVFTEKGHSMETIDAMHFLWNGQYPENRAPQMDSLQLNGLSAYDNIMLEPSKEYPAEVFIKNYENDSVKYVWEVMHESTDLGVGGDHESRPSTCEGLIKNENANSIKLTAPDKQGAYRLFVYAIDNQNKVATANIPFFVN